MQTFQVEQLIDAAIEKERKRTQVRVANFLALFDPSNKSTVTYDVLYKSLLGLSEAILDA